MKKPLYRLAIYGDTPSAKNSKRIVNKKSDSPKIVNSKKYKRWFKESLDQMKERKIPKPNFSERMYAKIIVYRKSRRHGEGDQLNFLQSPLDLIKKWGIIVDDSIRYIVHTDGSRIYFDYKNPRAEVELFLCEE